MSLDRFDDLHGAGDPAVDAARELALARQDADALAAGIATAEDETAPAFRAATERVGLAEAALIDAVPSTLEGALAKLLFHIDWMNESCGCLNIRGGHPLSRSVENLITGLEAIARQHRAEPRQPVRGRPGGRTRRGARMALTGADAAPRAAHQEGEDRSGRN
jgi:hypothetical protein